MKDDQPKKIVGSDCSNGNVSSDAKAWLFLTKYISSYTAEKLEESLKRKFTGRDFTCIQLKNNWNFNSFKVAYDPDIKDTILDAKMWPKGIEFPSTFFEDIPLLEGGNTTTTEDDTQTNVLSVQEASKVSIHNETAPHLFNPDNAKNVSLLHLHKCAKFTKQILGIRHLFQ